MKLVIKYLIFALAGCATAGPVEECPILQTTDVATPCHLKVDPSLQDEPVPPFVYALNLPQRTSATPCPVLQTVDVEAACYVPPKSSNDPAFVLTVSLPPDADHIDDSPSGIRKLKEAQRKAKEHTARKPAKFSQSSPELTQAVFHPQPSLPKFTDVKESPDQDLKLPTKQMSSFSKDPISVPEFDPEPASSPFFNYSPKDQTSHLFKMDVSHLHEKNNGGKAVQLPSVVLYQKKPQDIYGLPYLKR
ncbi:uncharacterized protein LOC106672418 isoform X2 [Cimex lectularius]|uniref:Uncharacterized protein n=1 Tax=Cimex lectularius TaxID=79782 RepID=A0A8I6S5Y3_CIMLE|nr:uncharacterized protein LOC106672418 isoform X2 [Cimex lectularius]